MDKRWSMIFIAGLMEIVWAVAMEDRKSVV